MMDIVQEWIDKAEADYTSALDLMNPPSRKPNLDLICFLTQQCVEKYLKGFLQAQGVNFEKTHDLVILLDLTLPFQPMWESWRASFRNLKDYAVEFRYPGEWANPANAKTALQITSSFRLEAREALGLTTE